MKRFMETNGKYRVKIIDKENCVIETDYAVDHETIAEEIEGQHIYSEPEADTITGVIGVVDSAEEDNGNVIADVSIYDDYFDRLLDDDFARPTPVLITDPSNAATVGVDRVYMADSHSSLSGEPERL